MNVVSGSGGGAALSVQLLSAAGGELRARIAATEPLQLLHYALVARGDVALAETLEVLNWY